MPPPPPRAAGRPVRPGDLALAAAVALIPWAGIAGTPASGELDAVGTGLLVAMGFPLILHRVAPLAVFAVTAGLHLAYNVLGYPEGSDWLAVVVALGFLTRVRGWRVAVPPALVLLLLAVSDGLQGVALLQPDAVLVTAGLGGAIAAGEWLRTRSAYLAALEERAAVLEQTRAEEARRMVDAERLRIARDVHDGVAHAIASINVQAGVGAHLAARDPEGAVRALTAIRRASGEALDDLRELLGMLRPDTPDEPARPRTLADLDEVLDRARAAGLRVEHVVEGDPAPLPAAVEGTAYRIVQESVTNTLRHAGARSLRVVRTHAADVLALEISDDGGGGSPSDAPTGHGIRGMRERAGLLGGSVEAGPAATGFVVRARLPVRHPRQVAAS